MDLVQSFVMCDVLSVYIVSSVSFELFVLYESLGLPALVELSILFILHVISVLLVFLDSLPVTLCGRVQFFEFSSYILGIKISQLRQCMGEHERVEMTVEFE